jgi:hypothetical protein
MRIRRPGRSPIAPVAGHAACLLVALLVAGGLLAGCRAEPPPAEEAAPVEE